MISLFRHLPRAEARAALISLITGIMLLVVKFTAYFLTGSTAIFADALEGIVNVTAAAVALYALATAHRPADTEHPYGHGKIEFFSAGFEGGMILLAAAMAVGKAMDTMVRHQAIVLRDINTGVALIVAALIANAIVGGYLIRTGKKTSSLILEADGWHLITDAVTSAAALVALLVVWATHFALADPLMAVCVSFYIAWMGIRLIRKSAAGLMDEQDAGDNVAIQKILDSHVGADGKSPRICSYHKLRHRHSGRYHWVDVHLVMPGDMDIDAGHQVASAIEDEIENLLGEGNATSHMEPCKAHGCANCATAMAAGPKPI